tara:strand:- start:23 stop:319 length:297 start_codon:yes stop_codon:yes gene_type:complete
MESLDETNDNNMITDYVEPGETNVSPSLVDDSYIRPEDKKQLLITIKKIYETRMPWADEVLLKVMIKYHYKEVIKNMIKSDYLEEIKKTDIDSLIEQL